MGRIREGLEVAGNATQRSEPGSARRGEEGVVVKRYFDDRMNIYSSE